MKIKVVVPKELTSAIEEIFPEMDEKVLWCLNKIANHFYTSGEHDGFRVDSNGNMYFLTEKDKK